MPTISMRPAADPRLARNFTLNQLNLLYDFTGVGVDLRQVHFYDYNPAFLASLPAALRGGVQTSAVCALRSCRIAESASRRVDSGQAQPFTRLRGLDSQGHLRPQPYAGCGRMRERPQAIPLAAATTHFWHRWS